MKSENQIKNWLLKAGLSEASAELYLFLDKNPGVSVSTACAQMKFSKSTIYRSYEELRHLGLLNQNKLEWKTALQVQGLTPLLRKLQNENRKNQRLIAALRAYDQSGSCDHYSPITGLEVLDEEETFQRYDDLAQMEWESILCYGNWEGLNNETRNLVGLEKNFIKNRLKKGGKALVVVTEQGPFTQEIVDFKDLDQNEQRSTKRVDEFLKPFWLNVFQGNDYVHLWYQDERKELFSTFIESKPLAEFYRNQIYTKI